MTAPATISNAANRPLNFAAGTVPDVSGALKDYFQPITFTTLVKTVVGYEVVETPTATTFMGIIQPFTPRKLLLLPEGQRSWTWYTLHADPVLTLGTDDVAIWLGKQTRVMSRLDYDQYGYVEYTLVQDWSGAGP